MKKQILRDFSIGRTLKGIIRQRISIIILVTLSLFIFGEVIFPGFMKFSHIMDILRLSVFLGIVALAQTLVVISGNEGIDLSVGSILSLGAVIAASLLRNRNANIPLSIVAISVAGFTIGLMNGIGIGYLRIPPLVMTLAMASVIEGTTLIYSKGYPTGTAPTLLQDFGSGRIYGISFLLIFWIIVAISATFLLNRTKWGKILYGIGENNLTATFSGINTKRFRLFVYSTSGAICSFAGLLVLAYTGTPYFNLGGPYVLPSVVAVVIGGVALTGGRGSYLGTACACILLTTMNSILIALQTGESVRQIVYGSVIVLLLLSSGERAQRS